MGRFAVAYNPTDGPTVIDHHGRVLGGGHWGAVPSGITHVRTAVDQGRLIVHADIPADANPDAAAAAAEVARLDKRVETLSGRSPDDLRALAETSGLYPAGSVDMGHVPPGELVYLLAVAGPDDLGEAVAKPAAASAKAAE